MANVQVIDGRQACKDILTWLDFTQEAQDDFVCISGCGDIAMMGLFSTDQVTKTCKCINGVMPANPLTTRQEHLIITLHFWVANKQYLQQQTDPTHKHCILYMYQVHYELHWSLM